MTDGLGNGSVCWFGRYMDLEDIIDEAKQPGMDAAPSSGSLPPPDLELPGLGHWDPLPDIATCRGLALSSLALFNRFGPPYVRREVPCEVA